MFRVALRMGVLAGIYLGCVWKSQRGLSDCRFQNGETSLKGWQSRSEVLDTAEQVKEKKRGVGGREHFSPLLIRQNMMHLKRVWAAQGHPFEFLFLLCFNRKKTLWSELSSSRKTLSCATLSLTKLSGAEAKDGQGQAGDLMCCLIHVFSVLHGCLKYPAP